MSEVSVRLLFGIAVSLALVGCDGATTPSDGGRDASMRLDASEVEVCERDTDCDDGVFCNGAERCAPGGLDETGCAVGVAPCDAAQFCSEELDRCLAAGCESPNDDRDGDLDPRVECGGTDCDDDDPAVSGMANELCDDAGVDEDCDPTTIYQSAVGLNDGDLDGDGHVDDRCFNLRDDGSENRGDDCDDSSESVHGAAIEACNLVDDDCDGLTDEGLAEIRCLPDADGDGAPGVGEEIRACACPTGYAPASGERDCEDSEPNAFPGQTAYFSTAYGRCTRFCTNSFDYDCNGIAEPELEIRCSLDMMLRCSSPPMPRDSHTASECGSMVEYVSCNEDCSLRSEGLRPLGCH